MSLRKFSFWLILITIVVGAIIPFAAQFLFPAIFNEYSPIGAEVWNQYVSIILGVVATSLSIISLILCFRSEDRSKSSNDQLQMTFERLNDKVEEIGQNQRIMEEKLNQVVPLASSSAYTKTKQIISGTVVDETSNNCENKDI